MRTYLIGLTTALMLVVAMPVHSGHVDGNKLMGLCSDTATGESRENAADYDTCVTQLFAYSYAPKMLAAFIPEPFCVPDNTSTEQLRQVFINYMNAHRADWHLPAERPALKAFEEAWPCPQ